MASRTAAAAALAAAAVLAASGSSAHAAPGWTPEADLRDATHTWGFGTLGFAQDGLQLAGWMDVNSAAPLDTTIGVAGRRPGSVFANDFTMRDRDERPVRRQAGRRAERRGGRRLVRGRSGVPRRRRSPSTPAIARRRGVGAARASSPPTRLDGHRVRRASRWRSATTARRSPARPPRAGRPGEPLTDARADVFVHPPGGGWDGGTRLGAPNRSVLDLALGVDAAGNATAAWLERFDENDPRSAPATRWSRSTGRAATGVWVNDGVGRRHRRRRDRPRLQLRRRGQRPRRDRLRVLRQRTDRDTFVTRRHTRAPTSTRRSGRAGAGDARRRPARRRRRSRRHLLRRDRQGDTRSSSLVVRTPGGGPFSAPKPIFAGAGRAAQRRARLRRQRRVHRRRHQRPRHRPEGDPLALGRARARPVARPRCEPARRRSVAAVSDRDGSIVAVW